MPATPSLDLDAVVPDRETVLIRTSECPDGKLFEFRGEMELGILAQQELGSMWTRIGEAWGDEGVMDRATAELVDSWLDEMLVKILHTPIDAEWLAALTDVKKMRVITYFLTVVFPKVTGIDDEPTPKRTRVKASTGAS